MISMIPRAKKMIPFFVPSFIALIANINPMIDRAIHGAGEIIMLINAISARAEYTVPRFVGTSNITASTIQITVTANTMTGISVSTLALK